MCFLLQSGLIYYQHKPEFQVGNQIEVLEMNKLIINHHMFLFLDNL